MTKVQQKQNVHSAMRGMVPLAFRAGKPAEGDTPAIPDTIHLIPIGQWEHPSYEMILITMSDIKEFMQNFNAKIRKGVFITAGHEGFEELPAVGWIQSLEAREDGLWGTVEWNELGKSTLSDKQYKFFSPEFYRDYEDPQTHQMYRNVLTGGALTKSPYFKELAPIVMSEKALKTFNQNNMGTLEEILAKQVSDLTEEDKTLIRENEASLTDEQKATLAEVLTPATPETPEAPAAPAEEPQAPEAPAAPQTEPVAASENGMVKITAAEYKALTEKADMGHQAFQQLERAEIAAEVAKMSFSATNTAGRFLPKSASSLTKFMESLNKSQRQAFSAIVAELPKATAFSEIGTTLAEEATNGKTIENMVNAKMKANEKLGYAAALKEVFAENPELAKSHTENPTA